MSQSIITSPEQKKAILESSKQLNQEWITARQSESFQSDVFRRQMSQKYSELYTKTQAIFNVAMTPTYDAHRLKFLLEQAYQVHTQRITEHDASVKVGQRLVDDIVRPQLKTNKH